MFVVVGLSEFVVIVVLGELVLFEDVLKVFVLLG